MTQGQNQRAIPVHRMAEDANARGIGMPMPDDHLIQLVHQIALHAVVRGPRHLDGVKIKASPNSLATRSATTLMEKVSSVQISPRQIEQRRGLPALRRRYPRYMPQTASAGR